jgi:hypothetical protein
MRLRRILPAWIALVAGAAFAQGSSPPPPPNLSEYLSDVTPGAVAAGDLVGLSQSVITQLQSSQDLAVALKPFSSDSSKVAYGLAITPARSGLIPFALVPATDYADPKKWYLRPLVALTLSYAENFATISGVDYRKNGFSLDTSYYFTEGYDPVFAGQKSFRECKERAIPELRRHEAGIARQKAQKALAAATTEEARQQAQREIDAAEAEIKKAREEYNAANKKCIDEGTKKVPWNASRVSVSGGAAWIRRDDGSGSKESLGKTLVVSGIWGAHDRGAFYGALRRTWQEVDLTTLATTPEHRNSTLAALRYAYGSDDNGKLKVLGEVSNAKDATPTESNRVFKYALGIDAQVAKGTWLEFRVGRSKTADGTGTQTLSLLTLNWTPSTSLFGK